MPNLAREIPEHIVAKARPLLERGIAKAGPDDCWPWLSATSYPSVLIDGAMWRVSRLVLVSEGVHLTSYQYACHTCDNPPCCNPSHLFAGTHRENVQDRLSKGRFLQRKGEQNPSARLTPEDVRRIRSSPLSCGRLAREYGVARSTIRAARVGDSWGHVQ